MSAFQSRPSATGRTGGGRTQRLVLRGLCALACAAGLVEGAGIAGRAQSAASAPPAQATAAPASQSGSQPSNAAVAATKQSIRVRVSVVNVSVTALDKKGFPVIDLTEKDFQVYEDGQLQTIRYFRREPQPPLYIGLILDTSNRARSQLSFEKDAASEFVFNMLRGKSTKNRIFLQTFDATSSLLEDFSDDPESLNEKIHALKAGGGKALYEAIYSACKQKMMHAGEPESVRRVLVVVSDGVDYQSRHTLEEALSIAHMAETVIYTIGNAAYGYNNPGDKVLAELSQETGGAAFFPLEETPGADLGTGYLSHGTIGDTSQNKGLGAETGIYSAERMAHLADSLDAINRELDEQYSIGYTPINDTVDGTYRAIRVVALRKGVQVRNKVGYFATPAVE